MKIYCYNEISKETRCFETRSFSFKKDRAKKILECANGHVCLFYNRPNLIMFRCPFSFKDYPNSEYIPFNTTTKYFPSGDPIKETIGRMEAFDNE